MEIDGQADECHGAEEEQHHEQDDRRDRVANRPGGNVLHELPAGCNIGFTTSPCCRTPPAVATTWSFAPTPSAMVTPFATIPDTRTLRRSTLFSVLTTNT